MHKYKANKKLHEKFNRIFSTEFRWNKQEICTFDKKIDMRSNTMCALCTEQFLCSIALFLFSPQFSCRIVTTFTQTFAQTHDCLNSIECFKFQVHCSYS